MNMKIGMDVTSLMYGRGVSRYTANLVRALARLPEAELRLLGYGFRGRQLLEREVKALIGQNPDHQIVIQNLPPKFQNLLWSRFNQNPISQIFPDAQVFHSWDWIQPPDKNLPLVSTIHDLAILKYPDTAHPDILAHHRHSWQQLKKRQAHIITVSHATRQDVLERLEFSPDRVHVIYEALPVEFRQVSQDLSEEEYERIKSKLQLSQPFILFVGTREPRKNLARLIKAHQALKNEVELLIVGEAGWDETNDGKLKTATGVRFLGKVSDKELAVLYSEAEVFAYPCLDEGFGLPILEAFYYGTPVLTSDRSAMKEVAGNAALLVDPDSIESIKEGLVKLLAESTKEQQQRLQKMIIRLQRFDWRQVAEATLRVYGQAIKERQ
jgi:glycosyltransferase involved in cell wall biosynthesis